MTLVRMMSWGLARAESGTGHFQLRPQDSAWRSSNGWRNNIPKKMLRNMVRDAELHKGKVFKLPDKLPGEMSQAEIDDEFVLESSHLDNATIEKIEKGQFVDLHKLLPKEKILYDEGKLQPLTKEGSTYFAPTTEKDTPLINNFKRWECSGLLGVCNNICKK